MKNNFDFENATKQVKSKRIQKYLEEVISTYNNCEYRSCIVMLYATTFADALAAASGCQRRNDRSSYPPVENS